MGRSNLVANKSVSAIIPDVETGALFSASGSLTTTPVATVTIPTSCIGFRIYPTTNPVRFAIDENPAAVGSFSTLNVATVAVGGVASAGAWTTRYIGLSDTVRQLRILVTTTTSVATELF